MNIEAVKAIFKQISKNNDGLDRLLLITDDGFPLVSTLDSGDQEGRTTAVGAILCDSSERGIRELALGQMEAVINVGSDGYFILSRICEGAILMAVAPHEVSLGLVLYRIRKAKPEILKAFEAS